MGKIGKALKKATTQYKDETLNHQKDPNATRQTINKSEVQDDQPKKQQGKPVRLPSANTLEQGPVDFRVIVYHKPESLAAEHFKVLRGNIMHPSDGRKIKSVLVTSALEQEGKTMVTCNLAVSIAQSLDPYVMLIDADVRRPNVHNMLGLSKIKGLTDYLQSSSELSEFLTKGPLDKMTVLQAGSTVRNPAELMTSEKMKHLIQEVRERYEDRFIVIDSAPINLAAETLIISQQVDAIIIVVRYGISDKNAIEEALSKIDRGKILGMVFNGFEVTPRKYTYYKKKYYYSSAY